jgi:hypothetical protein
MAERLPNSSRRLQPHLLTPGFWLLAPLLLVYRSLTCYQLVQQPEAVIDPLG